MDNVWDVIIVGAGPAGLTAAIYTRRRALKTLVLAKDVGGQLSLTSEIENYPGFAAIPGLDLANKFLDQAKHFGAEFIMQEAVSLSKEDKLFKIVTDQEQSYYARAIVLAFGLTPRNLGIPGEKELTGRGVAYCATCDGPLYKNKNVVVVGGANSAMDAAEYLSKIAAKVTMLVRDTHLKGEEILIDKVSHEPKINVIFGAKPTRINGEGKISSIVYLDQNNQENVLPSDGVFIEIGYLAKTDWVRNVVALNERNEVIIDADCSSSCPGVFAAGDISSITYKQAIISAGEGAKAALQAYKFLQGDKPLLPDWTKK